MCTQESPVHATIKEAITRSSETDTRLILRSLRNTSRVWRNALSGQVVELEQAGAGIDRIGPLVAGAKGRAVYESGDVEGGIWTVGMIQGLIDDIPTCGDLVRRIVDQAHTLVAGRLASLL
ncbi:Nitronate monooxygenase [compost metagenome]